VCTERRGELVMRFLSAAPADFLGRFLFCVWSAKEYPWWMLSPSSFLIFLLPFSIERERERGNTYIAHTNIYEKEAQRFVWRPEKTQPLPFSPNDNNNNNNQYSLCAFSIYNI
jgi:drug/metabolite transporter superfamily protein YnfA